MAWLQNLAGRAEDLLNKIDQNAATVLNDSNTKDLDEENILSVITNDNVNASFIVNETIERSTTPVNNIVEVSNENQDGKNIKIEDTTSTEVAISIISNNIQDNVFERPFKSDSPMSRSISSHNSFVFSEEVQNFNEKLSKLEAENQELNKQLLNLKHLYSQLRNENVNLKSQVESSNYLVATSQSEMEQYKARTQRILQEKEELIAIKNQSTSRDDSDNIFLNYNEELKKELEFQQNKNSELTEKIKNLIQETTYLQKQLLTTQNDSHQTNESLQESLAKEKKLRLVIEEEFRVQSNELQRKIQELSQQYSILEVKNEEIVSLKNAIKQKSTVNTNAEFEARIKSLTDTLVMKQSTLETITTERNALKLQLEKLENEYHNNLVQLERAQVRVINVNDTDDVKSQVPQFMRVSPFDAGVTRRVKHAYSTVDAISIRTGIFLRRYPVARVCVFCYMVLLQLWVLLILFIYAPNGR